MSSLPNHLAKEVVSPNFDARPATCTVSLIVIHAISLPPDRFGGSGVEQLFMNRLDAAEHPYYASIHHLRVSAHFFIRRTGKVIQFVDPAMRAWHAGVSSWKGRERCNDFSIGIELEGCDTLPFEGVQYRALAKLLGELCQHFPVEDVVGHEDVAPGRKTDPGPYFSWWHLRECLCADGHEGVADMLSRRGAKSDCGDLMRWPFPLAERPA